MTTNLSFGVADYGVAWAASQLPQAKVEGGAIRSGKLAVNIVPLAGAKGPDDYAIAFKAGSVSVKTNTAVGAISGLLALGTMLREGKKQNLTQNIRFSTRNYKHELRLTTSGPRSIVDYTDDIWETLCRNVVSNQFNGLTLYPGYHPFEDILDYKEFPQAASKPEAERTAIRKALNSGLAIAHKYGLKTFMQHYVGHFTQELADAYKIPTAGRLACIEHPEVDRYCRYCYRAIFEQVPDLDGLYFNFESSPDAARHVLDTAIPVFNKMKRPPIMMIRLWNYTDIEGMKKIKAAFKGKIVVSHKVSDTNDTYYLPEADSRIWEWKKAIPDIDWAYCIGPCHNCGTNLCDQVWGDYDFAHALIADTHAKGADSISFHTVTEFFSPYFPDPEGVFSQQEKDMARANRMHLQAVVDFFNHRTSTPAQQAAILAELSGVGARAAKDLHEAVTASSQQVLLVYQQFCHTSAMDGFLNNGRVMFTQEPFLFFPATFYNNQASRLPWKLHFTTTPWVDKTIDTKVAPDNFLQRVIEYVDPSKPKALRNPKKIADLLEKYGRQSMAAFKRFAKAAPKDFAARLEEYLERNLALGQYIRQELLAAIQLYSIYFATSKAAVVKALKQGIAHLEAMVPMVADQSSRNFKSMIRATMLDRMDPTGVLAEARETLDLVQSGDFPFEAFVGFVQSHRVYNDIRRYIRPHRAVDVKTLEIVRKQMSQAIAKGKQALAMLGDRKYEALADNVRSWVWFVENELARTVPPKAACPTKPGEFLTMQHDECFHMGRLFTNDFVSFFRPISFLMPAAISFRMWHTASELVVQLQERGVNVNERMARWDKWKFSGSDVFVFRIMLDTNNNGKLDQALIVWPKGSSVSSGRRPNLPVKTEFTHDATSWQTTAYLPFKLLGRKPKKGEVWGMTVSSNPAIIRNYSYSWAPQYDSDNAKLFGKIKFE